MDARSFDPVRDHLASRIIGQKALIDSLLVCLLSDGHMLIEGLPGLAKTRITSYNVCYTKLLRILFWPAT